MKLSRSDDGLSYSSKMCLSFWSTSKWPKFTGRRWFSLSLKVSMTGVLLLAWTWVTHPQFKSQLTHKYISHHLSKNCFHTLFHSSQTQSITHLIMAPNNRGKFATLPRELRYQIWADLRPPERQHENRPPHPPKLQGALGGDHPIHLR